ncbi:putative ABC transport system permease protein [Halanaerobium saccharolyticum]|uniref:Putative ABC transport system permease protein n=1 Tax=Halanaerobium saccharolyticum TaxID=43595 RepID=A0A2T5RL05_9FIRM|nr:FtsX-like permease family protein [Halanaerobium saccharolyticum]PTV99801.1 putative ABC transport system permease protein [Halanaerobium saccharolyticum]
MFLTRLAFKNLVRHKNRTLITAVIIAFAIFFYLIMDSLIGGMTEMSFDTIIDYEAGHLQVADQNYWEEKDELPLENLISEEDKLFKIIRDHPQHQLDLRELNFSARLNNGINELPIVAKGVKGAELLSIFDLKNSFVEGTIFTENSYQAVMGKRLADLMKLKEGDYFTLLVKDKYETFNTIDLEIVGLLHTINPNLNSNYVYLPLQIAQKSLNVDNSISNLIIELNDKNTAEKTAVQLENSLNQEYPTLEGYPWQQLDAVTVASAKQAGIQLVMVIILLIAAIAIINTVILAALERMEEIGMMLSLGLKKSEIIYIFIIESTGIGILGGLIGLILGFFGVLAMTRIGINFDLITGIELSKFGVPIIGEMYGSWNPRSFILVFAYGVTVSFLASILPAYWAAAKDPVEALHYE